MVHTGFRRATGENRIRRYNTTQIFRKKNYLRTSWDLFYGCLLYANEFLM